MSLPPVQQRVPVDQLTLWFMIFNLRPSDYDPLGLCPIFSEEKPTFPVGLSLLFLKAGFV